METPKSTSLLIQKLSELDCGRNKCHFKDTFFGVPELFSLMLEYCLPEENIYLSEGFAPLQPMRVCRSWRAVAINTPRLWTKLRLRLRELREPNDFRRYSDFLNHWFERSGGLRLEIALINTSGTTASTCFAIYRLCRELDARMDRISSLVLFIPSSTIPRSILSPVVANDVLSKLYMESLK